MCIYIFMYVYIHSCTYTLPSKHTYTQIPPNNLPNSNYLFQSLTSCDQGSLSGSEGGSRCRVILPDLTKSIIAIKNNESIQDLMSRLLERRGLSYSTFEVYHQKTDKVRRRRRRRRRKRNDEMDE